CDLLDHWLQHPKDKNDWEKILFKGRDPGIAAVEDLTMAYFEYQGNRLEEAVKYVLKDQGIAMSGPVRRKVTCKLFGELSGVVGAYLIQHGCKPHYTEDTPNDRLPQNIVKLAMQMLADDQHLAKTARDILEQDRANKAKASP